MHTKNKRFTYINKKENICDYFIDNEEGLDYTGHNLKEITDLLNRQQNLIDELYTFRLVYNALLFNTWYANGDVEVYKSKKHYDDEYCFDGEWFVVVAMLPTGQITNHYNILHWDFFNIPEYPKVKDEYDGHDSVDVLNRLIDYI